MKRQFILTLLFYFILIISFADNFLSLWPYASNINNTDKFVFTGISFNSKSTDIESWIFITDLSNSTCNSYISPENFRIYHFSNSTFYFDDPTSSLFFFESSFNSSNYELNLVKLNIDNFTKKVFNIPSNILLPTSPIINSSNVYFTGKGISKKEFINLYEFNVDNLNIQQIASNVVPGLSELSEKGIFVFAKRIETNNVNFVIYNVNIDKKLLGEILFDGKSIDLQLFRFHESNLIAFTVNKRLFLYKVKNDQMEFLGSQNDILSFCFISNTSTFIYSFINENQKIQTRSYNFEKNMELMAPQEMIIAANVNNILFHNLQKTHQKELYINVYSSDYDYKMNIKINYDILLKNN